MSIKSNVTIGKKAVKRMMAGIKIATQAIRLTYGPKGSNAVVENEFYPFHQVVNDAQTMVQAMQVEGTVEKRGLNFLKELMDKANKDSRDGRKTTAIIAEEILEEGIKSELQGMALKRQLDDLIPFIEQKIDEKKTLITEDKVHLVATIASESEKLGKLVGEMYQKVGKDGIIHVEGSGTYETTYSFIEGVRFQDAGFLSPFMVHDEQAVKAGITPSKAIYHNPVVLVTKKKINHVNDINPLLETLTKSGKKDLVIFTDDMDSGVASLLVNAHKSKVVNVLIIKCPVLWKNFIFEDFAKVTGATIMEDASGINFKTLKLSHLGTCEKIVTDKEETVITGGADISAHINELKAKGDNDSLIRLQWLSTKTAIIKLGANSESELSYLMLKCEDAKNASRLALLDGIVPGGGKVLVDVASHMPHTVAGDIVRKALRAPHAQIVDNMGLPFGAEFDPNVLDAAKVIKNAVRNAIGLASTILTVPIDIALPEKTPEQISAEALKGKGIRF